MERLGEEIRKIPFLKITIPFVIGIVISQEIRLVWSLVFLLIVALFGLIFLFKNETIKNCTTFLFLLSLGFASSQAAVSHRQLPRGVRVEALIEMADESHYTTNRRRLSSVAYVRAYRLRGDSVWLKSNEKVMAYLDTGSVISIGQLFAADVYVKDLDRSSSYSRLMSARGITGNIYVKHNDIRDWNVGCVNSLEYRARLFRNRISKLLHSRLDNPDDGAVLSALLTGDRSHLTPQLKKLYQRAGTSHILALSGLHISMIFILLNLLLKPIVFLGRASNLIKTLTILSLIWSYAYISGLSLSVCRAAIMITVAQLTLMTTTRANRYNMIFIAAFLTLVIWPPALFDISFQLSYAAMLAIVFFVPRFIRWIRVPRFLSWLRNVVAVTLAAQIGVAPLVVATFGTLSIVSLVINPVVSLTTPLIMLFGGAVGVPLSDSICEWVFKIHNGVISLVDCLEWGSVEDLKFSEKGVLFYYILLIIIMLTIKFYDKWHCLNNRKSEK